MFQQSRVAALDNRRQCPCTEREAAEGVCFRPVHGPEVGI
jgi:hypothetical protein